MMQLVIAELELEASDFSCISLSFHDARKGEWGCTDGESQSLYKRACSSPIKKHRNSRLKP